MGYCTKKRFITTNCLWVILVALAASVFCIAGCGGPSLSKSRPIPVIFDTDIGGDVDDAWALSFLLACPELDVKLIVSDSGDTVKKAQLVAKFLKCAGREDIPIGIGLNRSGGTVPQDTSLDGYTGKVYVDGVGALIDTIMNSEQPITLIATGPVPNLELALEREGRIVDNARLVVMGGCIGRQEEGEPGFPENNVVKNSKAARKAYGAGWDVTMTPLDTAGKVRLEGEDYARVRDSDSPVARMVMEQYYAWNKRQTVHFRDVTRTSSILWDTGAIYLAFDESFCRMRDIRLIVTDDGITKPSPDGKLTHVAIEWKDLDGFRKLLADRISNFKPLKNRVTK
jgi:inosine-uridine nucleoside N-ribohydrolase